MNGNISKNDRVNHPTYYQGQGSNGIECIDIIRHYVCDIANALKYLTRAGLKGEEGMTRRQKEIEDCQKAIWYLRDYMRNAGKMHRTTVSSLARHPSDVDCEAIASCYSEDIAQAFRELWEVGLIVGGVLTRPRMEMVRVNRAIGCIELHIHKMLSDSNVERKRL